MGRCRFREVLIVRFDNHWRFNKIARLQCRKFSEVVLRVVPLNGVKFGDRVIILDILNLKNYRGRIGVHHLKIVLYDHTACCFMALLRAFPTLRATIGVFAHFFTSRLLLIVKTLSAKKEKR